MAKERGGSDILSQILFYPVTDSNFNTDSYNKFTTKHWLTKEAMKWFWDNYLPDQERRNEPTASPLKASLEQLSELPTAMIINGEFDVLRDEGTAYAHKLIEAGVMVTAIRYLGTIHDFVLLNPITETPATTAAIKQANEMLIDVFKG
jgi:acetyl esterase